MIIILGEQRSGVNSKVGTGLSYSLLDATLQSTKTDLNNEVIKIWLANPAARIILGVISHVD